MLYDVFILNNTQKQVQLARGEEHVSQHAEVLKAERKNYLVSIVQINDTTIELTP
jgi:hypothetical protein